MNTLRIEIGADGVALLTIDVAERGMNVLTPQLRSELAQAVARIKAEPAISGAVITSGKANAFIAGADLEEIAKAYGRMNKRDAFAWSQEWSTLFRSMETSGKPFAAAINGLALGGGLELCLACHYRVLLDSPKAQVGLPEVKLGLLPGAGGTQRLPRMIGIPAALALISSGEPLTPKKALELGVVQAVLPAEELVANARAWVLAHPNAQQPWDVKGFRVPGGAGCLAPHANETFQAGTSRLAKSTFRNYPAPLAISAAVFEGTVVPIDTGLRIESKHFANLLTDPVARNLIRTMFFNKNAAENLARRPQGIAPSKVKKLGVLGAGLMGAGIAYVAAAAGIDVILLDTTEERATSGKAHSAKLLEKEIAKGSSTEEKAAALLGRISATTEYSRLSGCDLIIEAVFEDRNIKRTVLQNASAVIGGDTIVASNTSTLPITGLASAAHREDAFIGIHFFSPVERMPLVEVIRGAKTSDRTLAQALDFIKQLRKTPIVVNDSPGFFTSRVFGTFVDEGMCMLAEGIAPALIENAARMAGMPVGPLAVTDEVSIELQLKVHEQARADGLPPNFQRLNALSVIKTMVEQLGRKGRRGGAGFYEYPQGEKKHLWPGLQTYFPTRPMQPSADELRQRFLYIQALESARCIEEGVITHPADADLGSILGIGFPSWTGGTLSYIETVGIDVFVRDCERLALVHGARFEPSAWLKERAANLLEFHGSELRARQGAA